jgi:hypothetical protein
MIKALKMKKTSPLILLLALALNVHAAGAPADFSTAGLELRLSAGQVEQTDGTITLIKDLSGNENHARREPAAAAPPGNPTLVKYVGSGQPVLRFSGATVAYAFKQISDIRATFWVVSKDQASFGERNEKFVLGDKVSNDFHAGWTDDTILNTVALKTSGNGSTSMSPGASTTYALYIYTVTNVSAGNATLLATYTATATFTENDWLQWTNLGLALNPNSFYAFAHARTGDPGNAWERISVTNGNPYAGGQIAVIPAAGGAMNFGADSSHDMTFDLGLKLATASPTIVTQPVSEAVYPGQTATFAVAAAGNAPLYYKWQKARTNLTDHGNISGSATPNLTVSNAGEWNQADYVVVISDAAGQAVSHAATLGVGTWEEAGQGGIVTAVAASPDGAWLASGSDDATVKIWRAGDYSLARTLAAGGLVQVTVLAFGPVGTHNHAEQAFPPPAAFRCVLSQPPVTSDKQTPCPHCPL